MPVFQVPLPPLPPCDGRFAPVRGVVIAAFAVGIALRIAAAGGSLGLDEAWSLQLAATLPTIGDAFWGLPHDNNHPLNTAAMVALGPDRPVWMYRIHALAFGGLTILAVARALAWRGRVTAAIGAVLAAVTLPFVDFGSEARGYAGLVLASVVAIDGWRRAMDVAGADVADRPGRRGRWGLAVAAGLGAFCHLAMIVTVAVLIAATLMQVGLRSRRIGPPLRAATRLFAPTALALGPAGVALAVAIRRGGGFQIGDVDPFTPAKLVTGLGDMVALTLGVPASPVSPVLALVVLACLAAAVRRGLLEPPMPALCAAAFLVLPAALWAAGIPNVGYARYYAVCAIVLVLVLAEIVGRLWTAGGLGRIWAAAGLGAVLVASLASDLEAIRVGRSPVPGTLAAMQGSGAPIYATGHPRMTALLFGTRSRARLATGSCEVAPEWFIAVGVLDRRPDGTVTQGDGICRQGYRVATSFASNPLSGTQWTLYRRASSGPSRASTVRPGNGT